MRSIAKIEQCVEDGRGTSGALRVVTRGDPEALGERRFDDPLDCEWFEPGYFGGTD